MKKHNLVVGQKLWFVPSERRGTPREVTIVKVGREWAYLDNRYRIGLEGLWADGAGYMSPGRCYLSPGEHESAVTRAKAWEALRGFVKEHWDVPPGVSTEAINMALELVSQTPET